MVIFLAKDRLGSITVSGKYFKKWQRHNCLVTDHTVIITAQENCVTLILSEITAHWNCISIHNSSQRGITTHIETPIVSRSVSNYCAHVKSITLPQEQSHFCQLDHFSEAYQALPCSLLDQRQRSLEGGTYPASPLSSWKPPGSFQLSCLFFRPPERQENKYTQLTNFLISSHLFEFLLSPRCERMRRGGQVVLISSTSLKTSFPPAATLKVLHSKTEREIW